MDGLRSLATRSEGGTRAALVNQHPCEAVLDPESVFIGNAPVYRGPAENADLKDDRQFLASSQFPRKQQIDGNAHAVPHGHISYREELWTS